MYIEIFVILFLLISIFVIRKIFMSKNIQENTKEIEVNSFDEIEEITAIENISTNLIKKETEIIYELQTHKVKYLIYDYSRNLTYEFRDLYIDVVLNNLWINEPFHSIFYKLLILFDKDELMIKDKNSKILTLNIRDQYSNNMIVSKSYQVFSSKKILNMTLIKSINEIIKFNKDDAQNIILAICIITLQKSLHFSNGKISNDSVDKLLTTNVKAIITMIQDKHHQLLFIEDSFLFAFLNTITEPYNDSEELSFVKIPTNLPKKILTQI